MEYDDASNVTRQYWLNLSDDQQMIQHYGRRVFEDNDIPTSIFSLYKEKDLWEGGKVAIAHNLDGVKSNVDYRGLGKRYRQQAIYDIDGILVEDYENMGSLDYVPPGGISDVLYNRSRKINDHLLIDTESWIIFGNTPQDNTTRLERGAAMAKTYLGRKGLKRLGYSNEKIKFLQKFND